MKKKTAVALVCAICAASVAVGVAAKGVYNKAKKEPKSDEITIELDDEDGLQDKFRLQGEVFEVTVTEPGKIQNALMDKA